MGVSTSSKRETFDEPEAEIGKRVAKQIRGTRTKIKFKVEFTPSPEPPNQD